eukprot:jgi/Ulvmu1/5572/UM023_0109.1
MCATPRYAASHMQALRRAIQSEGKPMYFAEAATEEELVLVEMSACNPFTAAQMISYAYTKSIDLQTLMGHCVDVDGVLRVCHGVDRRVAEAVAAHFKQAQDELSVPDAPAIDQVAGPELQAYRQHPLAATTAQAAMDTQHHADPHHSLGCELGVAPGHATQTQAHTICEQAEAHHVRPQRELLASQPQRWPMPAQTAPRGLSLSPRVPHSSRGGSWHLAPAEMQDHLRLPGTSRSRHVHELPEHEEVMAGDQQEQPPAELGVEWDTSPATAHMRQDVDTTHRTAGSRKRPFSSLKDASVRLNHSLLPPQVGLGTHQRTRHGQASAPDLLEDDGDLPGMPQKHGDLQLDEAILNLELQADGNCGIQGHGICNEARHGPAALLGTKPRPFDQRQRSHHAHRQHPDSLQAFDCTEVQDVNEGSDASDEESDLEQLLRTQGQTAHCSRKGQQVIMGTCYSSS